MTALLESDNSPMSPIELSERKRLEKIVNATLNSTMKCVSALKEIHDKKLYRDAWSNWANYLEERWEISPREYSHQVTLQAIGGPDPETKAMLPTEHLTRPLHRLPDELKVEAWELAKEYAGEGVKPKLEHVYKAAREVAPEICKPPKPKTIDDVDKAKAAGIVPKAAVVEIVTHHADENAVCATAIPNEDELTDDEWLAREEILAVSSKLDGEILLRFRSEAIAYRHLCQARRELIVKAKPIFDKVKKAHGGYIGPYMKLYYSFVSASDPTRWYACDECAGGGQKTLIGNCDKCYGKGYLAKG